MAGAGLYEVGPGKTYATIQGALDQLWTDQGASEFTASQIILIFADTYDENVTPNAGLNTADSEGFTLVLKGDPNDVRANIILAPSSGSHAIYVNCDDCLIQHLTIDGSNVSDHVIENAAACRGMEIDDVDITATPANKYGIAANLGIHVHDTTITTAEGNGIQVSTAVRRCIVERCTFTRTGSLGGRGLLTYYRLTVAECRFDGFADGVYSYYNAGMHRITNCTIYGATDGISLQLGTLVGCTILNNIIHSCAKGLRLTCLPDEASDQFGGPFVLRDNYFYNNTTDVYTGSNKTLAEFIAFDRVDASGDVTGTDPLLTNPGASDLSLQAASPCRHAGHGSGAIWDADGTAYDPYHPDVGGWSSGILTVSAPSITAAVDDESGTTATLTLNADNAQDVLSVYYRKTPGTAGWTLFGSTRTGDGDLQITGLEESGYEFISYATRGGVTSLPSDPAFCQVTTGVLDLEEAFRRLVLSLPAVTDLVGERVYAIAAPQNVPLPYIVTSVVSDVPGHHMKAASNMAEARIQADLYAVRYEGTDSAKALAKAMREGIDGYDSTVTFGADSNQMEIWLENQTDGNFDPEPGAEVGPFRVIQDYMVQHRKTIPSP